MLCFHTSQEEHWKLLQPVTKFEITKFSTPFAVWLKPCEDVDESITISPQKRNKMFNDMLTRTR